MIIVKVQRLTRSATDLSDDLVTIPIANKTAEVIAEDIRKRYGTVTCPDHPNQDSMLNLKVNAVGFPTVDKSGFCCEKFSNKVVITIDAK